MVVCDACKKNFLLQKELIKTENKTIKGKQVKVKFFACPRCGEKYIFSVMDKKCLKLIEKLNRLREQVSISTEEQKYQKVLKSIEDLNRELDERMGKLIRESKQYI